MFAVRIYRSSEPREDPWGVLGLIDDDELFPRDERLPFCIEPRFAPCGLHVEVGATELLSKGCLAALTRPDQRHCGEPLELGTDLPRVDAWNHVLNYGSSFLDCKPLGYVSIVTLLSPSVDYLRSARHLRVIPVREALQADEYREPLHHALTFFFFFFFFFFFLDGPAIDKYTSFRGYKICPYTIEECCEFW